MSEDWHYLPSKLALKLHDQDSKILAKEETNRSMKQNRESRNRPRQTQSINLWQGAKANQWIKDNLFNKWC